MRKPILAIFYQFNPWRTTIGGIQTVISTFIKYALSEFEVRLLGNCFLLIVGLSVKNLPRAQTLLQRRTGPLHEN